MVSSGLSKIAFTIAEGVSSSKHPCSHGRLIMCISVHVDEHEEYCDDERHPPWYVVRWNGEGYMGGKHQDFRGHINACQLRSYYPRHVDGKSSEGGIEIGVGFVI